jgi:T-complex protein 1 subunit zeta
MSSFALQDVAPGAEIVSKTQALRVNAAAAVGLQKVLQSNLGPAGTLKLLVGGSLEQLRLTKDGSVLLKEMQIQHPTAALIARTASAQDAVTGDGTTTVILLVGELLRVAEQLVSAGGNLHPRHVVDGYELALHETVEFLDKKFKVPLPPLAEGEEEEEEDAAGAGSGGGAGTSPSWMARNRDVLLQVARTSLSTKLDRALVEKVRGGDAFGFLCARVRRQR